MTAATFKICFSRCRQAKKKPLVKNYLYEQWIIDKSAFYDNNNITIYFDH